MKLLITGGAGFIGSALVRHAVAQAHDVITVDALTYAGSLHNIAEVLHKHTFVQNNICNFEGMREIFTDHAPDAVIHLAAETHVDRSLRDPSVFVKTNILGTEVLLRAAQDYWERAGRFAEFRFLHVSTDEVFGALGPNDPPFTVQNRYDPRSPYAASKAAADHLVRAWGHSYGLPVMISHCTNTYGPYQLHEKLIPHVIRMALQERPIPIYGQGAQIRDWLYVSDHVTALMAMLSKGQPGQSYLIGASNEWRNIDLVQKICALLDEKRPGGRPHARHIRFVEDRLGHDFRYAADPSAAMSALGWQAKTRFVDGLAETVAWYSSGKQF